MEILLPSSSDNVTYRYTVSSLQLCACSPVFRAMLGPKSSFAEAVGLRQHRFLETDSDGSGPDVDGPYKLEVEDHDPTALAVILNVMHARTKDLPDEIPFDGLLHIAIICDFYDCAAVMRPWDNIWMKQWKESAETSGFEGWLLVARVFGEKDIFGDLFKKIVRNSIVENGEFKVVVSNEPRVVNKLDSHIPQGIVDFDFSNSNVKEGAYSGFRCPAGTTRQAVQEA